MDNNEQAFKQLVKEALIQSARDSLRNLPVVAQTIKYSKTPLETLYGTIPGGPFSKDLRKGTIWAQAELADPSLFESDVLPERDEHGWPALCYLYIKGNTSRILVGEKELQYLPHCLYVALFHGQVETVAWLLKMHPKPEPSVWYAFFAIAGQKPEEMFLELERYMTPIYRIFPPFGTVMSSQGWPMNLAQWAIIFRSKLWLDHLLCPLNNNDTKTKETMVDSKLPNGMNLFHLAAIVGEPTLIDVLMSHSVKYEKDNEGYYPVCYNPLIRDELLEYFNAEVIDCVLIGPNEEFTMCHLAVATGNEEFEKKLVKSHVNPNLAVSPGSLRASELRIKLG